MFGKVKRWFDSHPNALVRTIVAIMVLIAAIPAGVQTYTLVHQLGYPVNGVSQDITDLIYIGHFMARVLRVMGYELMVLIVATAVAGLVFLGQRKVSKWRS